LPSDGLDALPVDDQVLYERPTGGASALRFGGRSGCRFGRGLGARLGLGAGARIGNDDRRSEEDLDLDPGGDGPTVARRGIEPPRGCRRDGSRRERSLVSAATADCTVPSAATVSVNTTRASPVASAG